MCATTADYSWDMPAFRESEVVIRNAVKCSRCGQWGEEKSLCGHCGASIDGMESDNIPDERILWEAPTDEPKRSFIQKLFGFLRGR
jgi:hypothetical protein